METSMKYARIAGVDKPVSRILLGTAMPPFQTGGDGNALLDACYELGVTSFDTARVYGKAELSLGRWIEERNLRDQVVILSKCGHPTPLGRKRINEKEIRKDLKQSLKDLRTNYIDIYLLHRDDPTVTIGEIVELFNALHAEGSIGAFGGSNWRHERIAAANEYAYKHNLIPFQVSSPHYGLAEQITDIWGGGCVSISGPKNEAARAWYAANAMPIMAYSSLGGGMFSGKLKSTERARAKALVGELTVKGYGGDANFERLRRCEELAKSKQVSVSQIAMAYLFHQDLNTFALVSTTKPQRMQENIQALTLELSEREVEWLDLRGEG